MVLLSFDHKYIFESDILSDDRVNDDGAVFTDPVQRIKSKSSPRTFFIQSVADLE